MRQSVLSSAVLGAILGIAGCASSQEAPPPKAAAPVAVAPPVREQYMAPGVVGEKITVVATVTAVDLATRHVTLRGPEGNEQTIAVGDEVRNLPQVRVGDKVVVEYFQGLAAELTPSGSGIRKRVDTVTAQRAKLGQKPAGMVTKTIEVDAKVEAVDPVARTVTLQGPKRSITLKAAPDTDLSAIKVGDTVHAVYQEAMAISVHPVGG